MTAGVLGLAMAARSFRSGCAIVGAARAFERRFGWGGGRLWRGHARHFDFCRFRRRGARLRGGALGFVGLALCFFGSLDPGFLFLTAAIGFLARLVFGITFGLRLFQLAQRVFALGIDRLALILDHAALDVGALLPHLDIDGLRRRATLPRVHRQLADGATLECHLPRRIVITAGFALAMVAAQKTEQLDLFGAADRLLRVGETHAGFSQLREQLVHRSGQHRGQLLDCYVRHFLFTPDLPAIA